MRLLKVGVIGALSAMLIVPGSSWAASRPEALARDQLDGSTRSGPPTDLPATLLIVDSPDPKQSDPPSGQGERIGRSFDRFGDSVTTGAKGVGHAVEGGAKKVGRSVVAGWEAFKRNFNGQ